MGDIAMNSFPVVTDAEYVYIELANGSQGKMKKSDLIEIIRENMPIATANTNGLMSNKSVRTFTPMQSAFINPGEFIEVENVCGFFVIKSIYSSHIPAIFIASTGGGILKKIDDSGPTFVSIVNSKIRISNPYSAKIGVQYCYQNIGE